MTGQLLAFSRKQVLAIKAVDLSVVVSTLEPMLRRLLGEPIRINTRLADDLAPVMADVTQLEHLLINLSVNARDAMPQGGDLTIATGNRELDPAFAAAHPGAKPGSYAWVSVADTGVGMPPDVMARIFEPFFYDQRGRAWHGSTFTTYLPKTEHAVHGATVSPPVGSPVGEETILIVEDENGVRAFAKVALERFGYRVIEADTAEATLTLLDRFEEPIHLLLTDGVLPGMDGRELAMHVIRSRPTTRVLFMSGYPSGLQTGEGFLMPGVQLIEKPFTAQALLAKTRQTLDLRATEA